MNSFCKADSHTPRDSITVPVTATLVQGQSTTGPDDRPLLVQIRVGPELFPKVNMNSFVKMTGHYWSRCKATTGPGDEHSGPTQSGSFLDPSVRNPHKVNMNSFVKMTGHYWPR
ncbi:hypothetical protein AVEN_76264-1 [Araneus ventricosus]|uniref:Uncharacterized protein n=1 Tax=Araneus ventricosus TaxID=182803 RepID=A0A4Y2LYU8_ARAVE|nr:hypothetical protein AVEN_76264-1 [Araneus ventricosus]